MCCKDVHANDVHVTIYYELVCDPLARKQFDMGGREMQLCFGGGGRGASQITCDVGASGNIEITQG